MMQLKRRHVFVKTAWHCLIGITEHIGIPYVLAFLSTFLAPLTGDHVVWQWVERVFFCFTIYEIVIISIRKMIIDTRIDALQALQSAYQRALLHCESRDERIKRAVEEFINRQLDSGVLNQMDIQKAYVNLGVYMERNDITAIKNRLITIDINIKGETLLWNYTLILRLFK